MKISGWTPEQLEKAKTDHCGYCQGDPRYLSKDTVCKCADDCERHTCPMRLDAYVPPPVPRFKEPE